MIDQVLSTIGAIARVSAVLQTLAPGRPGMTADDAYSVQFECVNGAQGLLVAALAAPGPLVMATKVVGSGGGAWIQSGAAFGDPAEVWLSDGHGPRRVPMPDDLVNAPPSPFPIAELIQTEQDRWHTTGFDVAPYARLFGEMRRRIASEPIESRELAGSFADAVAGQAVLDAARRSAAEGCWVEVEPC